MDILQVISFPMRVEVATNPMFLYGELAGRVIVVRAAPISVEEAARVSSESVPNDGGDTKVHDGSVSEGLASYQGHFPVDDRAFEYLPSAKVRGEKTPPWRQGHTRRWSRPNRQEYQTQEKQHAVCGSAKEWHVQRERRCKPQL